MLSVTIPRQVQRFDVHGAGVTVHTDDDRAYLAISEFLSPFACEGLITDEVSFDISTAPRGYAPDLDAEPVWESGYFTMSKSGNRRLVWARGIGTGEADLDTGQGSIWTDGWDDGFTWGMTRLLFLPLWAMLLKTTGRFTIHAAAVAREDRALLFPVRSGGGKSTLTMSLVRGGYDLLSDDTQFIIPEGDSVRIAPFTERIALRRGSLEFFPEYKSRSVGEGHRVCIDPVAEGIPMVTRPIDPGIIAFPHLTGSTGSSFEPVASSEALQRLILSSFFFTDQAVLDGHLQALSALVANSRCYRLGVGTSPASLVDCVQRMEAAS